MTGGIDDVDDEVTALYRSVLGEDRDPLLTLEIHRVHDAILGIGLLLMRCEGAGLPEHRIDERRLAMVDVGDDRDIAKVLASSLG